MRHPETEKVTDKKIQLYSIYMRYAMESFAKEIASIKVSIASAVMEELKTKNPDMDTPEVEQRVKKIIDGKLSVLAKIDFEE